MPKASDGETVPDEVVASGFRLAAPDGIFVSVSSSSRLKCRAEGGRGLREIARWGVALKRERGRESWISGLDHKMWWAAQP
jgi:hypothetical protein